MSESSENKAESIIKLATDRAAVEPVTTDHGTFVAIPQGRTVKDITDDVAKHAPSPRRAKGTAVLTTEGAFLAHVDRFSDAAKSAVFLSAKGNATATAVYDYHWQDDGEATHAAWCEHRATFTPSQSRQWQWLGQSARAMSQPDFAAWMEDALQYVVNPDEAKGAAKVLEDLGYGAAPRVQLLAFSRDVSLRVDTEAQSMTRLDTGAVRIVYAETLKSGDSMTVPSGFILRLPVLDGDAATADVPVRLRVKVVAKAAQLTVVPIGADDVLRAAVEACFARIRGDVGCAVFDGSPER